MFLRVFFSSVADDHQMCTCFFCLLYFLVINLPRVFGGVKVHRVNKTLLEIYFDHIIFALFLVVWLRTITWLIWIILVSYVFIAPNNIFGTEKCEEYGYWTEILRTCPPWNLPEKNLKLKFNLFKGIFLTF